MQIALRIGIVAGARFRAVSGFRGDGFRQDILLFKQHIEYAAYLGKRPLPAHKGGDGGDQHIGVMLDVVQIKMVLIVVVGAFVGVKILLQFRFHGAILRLCRQHIRVLAGIGGHVDAGGSALNQHGAGGHGAEDEDDHCRDAAYDKKALFVTGDELTGFLCVLCGFPRRL